MSEWREIDELKRQLEELRTRERSRQFAARVRRGTAQTLTTGVAAAISFDSPPRVDTGGFWSAANPTRLTIALPGFYLFGGNAGFAANATGIRSLDVYLNGATVVDTQLQVAASGIITIVAVPGGYRFVAGDYIEMFAFQNSGGNLNVNSTGNYSPEFWVLGPF